MIGFLDRQLQFDTIAVFENNQCPCDVIISELCHAPLHDLNASIPRSDNLHNHRFRTFPRPCQEYCVAFENGRLFRSPSALRIAHRLVHWRTLMQSQGWISATLLLTMFAGIFSAALLAFEVGLRFGKWRR